MIEMNILESLTNEEINLIAGEGCQFCDSLNDFIKTDKLYKQNYDAIWSKIYEFCENMSIEVSQFLETYDQTATNAQDLRQQLCHFYIESLVDEYLRETM